MILRALYEYYQRNKDRLPPKGFQSKEIKFVIEIDEKGRFLNLLDRREGKKGTVYRVPKDMGRFGANAWMKANLLWDHYGYLLAHPKDSSSKSLKMAKKQQKTFIEKINGLPKEVKRDAGVNAVLLFYEKGCW